MRDLWVLHRRDLSGGAQYHQRTYIHIVECPSPSSKPLQQRGVTVLLVKRCIPVHIPNKMHITHKKCLQNIETSRQYPTVGSSTRLNSSHCIYKNFPWYYYLLYFNQNWTLNSDPSGATTFIADDSDFTKRVERFSRLTRRREWGNCKQAFSVCLVPPKRSKNGLTVLLALETTCNI